MNNIVPFINWLTSLVPLIAAILAAVFGLLCAIVKFFPTLNEGWMLELVKVLGKITNRQTPDAEIRANRKITAGK